MKDKYKKLLRNILQDRLLDNWNKCEQLPMDSAEYNIITDECNQIHEFISEENIPIDTDIAARF